MIGIHIKTKRLKDMKLNLKYANQIGCTHIQLFGEDIDKDFGMKSLLKKYKLSLIIHSPYIFNIAATFNPHDWKMKYLIMELRSAKKFGASGYVIHMGKQMNLTQQDAYNNMYRTLEFISKETNQNFQILLETTAGQGTELCYKLEDLSIFFGMVKHNPKLRNIKICLDTCHLFAAGYDLRTKKNVDTFIKKFNKLIGIQYVGLIHLNDSINELGSHKDRHMNIGNGYIGMKGLKYFYECFSKINVPSILETPIENYAMEIKMIKAK